MAVWIQSLPTVEGWAWDLLFFVGFAGLFLLSSTTLVRLFFLWGRVKGLLDAIAAQPMMRAFGRLPTKVTEIFGRYLFTQRPHLSHLQVAGPPAPAAGRGGGRRTRQAPAALRGPGADGRRDRRDPGRAARGRPDAAARPGGPSATSATSCRPWPASAWRSCAARGKWLAVDDAFGGGPGKDEKKADPAAEPAWVALAESVAATQVVIYVSQFFVQLRNLVWAAVVTSSLLLLAATSYPFHPEKLLLIGLIALSGAGMAGVLYVLIEMNRDEVVSRVTQDDAGQVLAR